MQNHLPVSRATLVCSLVAIVSGIFFLVFWMFPTSEPGSVTLLSPEFLREYGYTEGSFDQRSAHLFAVMAIAGLSVIGFVVAKYRRVDIAGHGAWSINLWQFLLGMIIAYVVYQLVVPLPINTATRINAIALVLAGVVLLFAFLAPRLARWTVELSAVFLIGGYIATLIVPGLMTRPIPLLAADPSALAQLETHLNSLTEPGIDIAAGLNLFDQLPFNYGLLMPSIMSVMDHRLGALTVGGEIQFVQWCQVLLTLTAVAGYLCYRPRAFLGVLAALLLAGPYWATAGLGEWHPNQTGFRSLTLPIAFLVLALSGRCRPKEAAWGLGAASGLALLINLETTVAIGVGYLVYMGLRARQHLVVPILRMAVAAVAVVAAYLLLYRIGLGRLPFGSDLSSKIFMTLREHVSGDIGLRLFIAGVYNENYYVVPFVLVMFVHASYVIIDAFVRLAAGPLPHRAAFRAAVAATLILWLAYYFNLPNWWQIWTHYFLYGYLLIDLFDPRLFGVGREGAKQIGGSLYRPMRSRMARAVPIILLAFLIPYTNSHLIQYMRDFMYPSWVRTDHDASVVSGVLLPRAMAEALKEKVGKLIALNQETGGKLLYLTFNSNFVPVMSRVFMPAPERNLWGYIGGGEAFDEAIDKIAAKRPNVILIDAPDGPLAVSGARRDFQDHVRRSLGRAYHLADTQAGWQIWRPNPAP